MDVQKCESCGMTMASPDEHGGGDPSSRWCVHCTDEAGRLKPYDVKLAEIAGLIARQSGLGHEEAFAQARSTLSGMPAWRGKAALG